MATILDTLKAVSAYPIQARVIEDVCLRRGLVATAEATAADVTSEAFNVARADLLLWLSSAPNISQGGQSYSFSEFERKRIREQALAVLGEYEETAAKPIYGYKGTRL